MSEDYVTRILATLHKSPKSKDIIQKYIKSPRYFDDRIDQEIYLSLLTFEPKDGKVEAVTVHRRIADKSVTLQQVQNRMNDFREVAVLNQLDMTAVLSKLISDITASRVVDEVDSFKLHLKQNVNVFEACDNLVKKVSDIRQYVSVSEMKDKEQQVNAFMTDLQRRINKEIKVLTHFTPGLTKAIGSMEKGDLVYIGARPAMGKTQVAVQYCNYFAKTLGKPTVLFPLEMSEMQMIRRFIATSTGISPTWQLEGDISPSQYQKIETYMQEYRAMPLIIDDKAPMTISEIANKISHYTHYYGTEVVIIDYVGLIKPSNPRDKKNDALEEVSQTLKQLARNLNVLIIGFLQLNRNVTAVGRSDPRPMLSDIRDSGSLEQDADAVLFIHRPSMYKKTDDIVGANSKYISEIVIGKNRMSTDSAGMVHKIVFDPVYQTFKDYDEIQAEQELKEIQKEHRKHGIL